MTPSGSSGRSKSLSQKGGEPRASACAELQGQVIGTGSKILRRVALAVAFIVVVTLLMMWLAGAFEPKIGDAPRRAAIARSVGDAALAPVRTIRVPRMESAVGSIRAVHETSVASKLLAKVLEINVTAGKRVSQGEVLVRLDDADLRARLQQAQAAADAAMAARDQAKIELDRVRSLSERGSAAKIELDRADTALKAAEAQLRGAEQAVSEAQTMLAYATIQSPLEGIVVDKLVEAGDMVTPGQTLITLYDPTRMQLVASVRESLTRRLTVGQTIGVQVDALDKTCEGRVSEIVPEAESASRSFSVKVTGPCPPGIYSGMFGRLLIPLDEEEVLVVPRLAVRRVGQLQVVDVADGSVLRRRSVQLGRPFGADVEVLSGLIAGERVAVPDAADAARVED